jgi:micrococcal nuclease
MKHLLMLLCLPLTISCNALVADEASANSGKGERETVRITGCHDGDTCRAYAKNGDRISVRLSGIDAPEVGQDFCPEAIAFLESMVKDRDIDIECDGTSYARRTCFLFADGLNVNEEMVKAGFAWDFPRHSGGRYAPLEADARRNQRGLWAGKKIVSPFCARMMTSYSERLCKTNPQYQD